MARPKDFRLRFLAVQGRSGSVLGCQERDVTGNPDLRVSRPAVQSPLFSLLLAHHFAFQSSVFSSDNKKVLLNQRDNFLPIKINLYGVCAICFFPFFFLFLGTCDFYLLRLYTRGQWYIKIIIYECSWYCTQLKFRPLGQ